MANYLYSDLALVAGRIELRSALPDSTLGWHPAAGGPPSTSSPRWSQP